MRILMISAIILIIGLAVLTVYLNIDEKRFEESLSKPTATGSDSVNKKDVSSKTGSVGDPTLETVKPEEDAATPATDTQTKATLDLEALIDEAESEDEEMNSEQDTDGIDEHVDAEENASSAPKNRDPKEYLYHTPSGRPDPIYAMSPSEQGIELKRRRQKLIEDYGDTPEVRILNKHFNTTVRPPGTSQRLKGEEGMEVLRAMSVVWPTVSNVNTYNSLKAMQENGWHAQ